MWDWHWWLCFRSLQKQPHHSQSLLLQTHPLNDAVCPNSISLSSIASMFTSWLNRRRWRYLFLILCTPFLIPLICATCPLLCAFEVCSFLCRRRPRKMPVDDGIGRPRRCEEGGNDVGLLQRYLEDQLSLVVGSMCECGDEDGVDVEYFDSSRGLLQ